MGYIGHMAPKPPWEVRYLSNLLPQTRISKSCFKNFQAWSPPLKPKKNPKKPIFLKPILQKLYLV